MADNTYTNDHCPAIANSSVPKPWVIGVCNLLADRIESDLCFSVLRFHVVTRFLIYMFANFVLRLQ